MGFPGVSDGKESACNVGNLGSNPRSGRSPRGGYGNLLQHSCLENPRGQRSLEGCCPRGRKESDVTEQLSIYLYTYISHPKKVFSKHSVKMISAHVTVLARVLKRTIKNNGNF